MREIVETGIPEFSQPFSWAVKARGNLLFTVHGPIKSDGSIDTSSMESQARLTFANLKQAVQAAGGNLNDVAQVIIYTTAIEESPIIDQVYRDFFSSPWPSRATLGVANLVVPGMKIEIVAYAAVES